MRLVLGRRGASFVEYMIVLAALIATGTLVYGLFSRAIRGGSECEGKAITSSFAGGCAGDVKAMTGTANATIATPAQAAFEPLVCDKLGCRPGSNNCFAAGTLVHTAEGPRAIESIAVGALVIGSDEATRDADPHPVERVTVTPNKEVMEVGVTGGGLAETETFRVTLDHAFWVVGKEWVRASELQPGDAIQTRDGASATVQATRQTHEVTTVYNLEVEKVHTYHVGKRGLLNRSSCERVPPSASLRARASTGPLWSSARFSAISDLAACSDLTDEDYALLASAVRGERDAKREYLAEMKRSGHYATDAERAEVDAELARPWFERAERAVSGRSAVGRSER